MNESVTKRKYTDDELELEFENALKEVMDHNLLMVKTVSEGFSSLMFKLTFLVALAGFIGGVSWSISSLIIVVGHLSTNVQGAEMIITPRITPYYLFIMLGMALFMFSGNVIRKLMKYGL